MFAVDDSGGGFISVFAVDKFAPVAAGAFPYAGCEFVYVAFPFDVLDAAGFASIFTAGAICAEAMAPRPSVKHILAFSILASCCCPGCEKYMAAHACMSSYPF